MVRVDSRIFPALLALALAAGVATDARAQPSMDPAATKILKRMTDYMGSLKAFSLRTQNTVEDLIAPGLRVDLDVSATVTIERPNKLLAERKGDLVSQNFYYDGKTLTLYDPAQKVYATEPAPPTLVEVLEYAGNTLGLVIPAADLVYPDAYALLMRGVTSAVVIGKTVVDGVKCDHLLFRRPGVDFQLFVADGKAPRPVKLVVTDTETPELLSVSTVISNFKALSDVPDAKFRFAPPKRAKPIAFMHRNP
jgi:hypothetical protein